MVLIPFLSPNDAFPSITGIVEDIIIVPVGIAYDKLLERRFVRHELMVCLCFLEE